MAGDQWPIFLYANYTYDPEDPWNGLLRSGLLVDVRPLDARDHMFYTDWFSWRRHTNTSLRLRVLWIRNLKQPVLEMPVSTACVQRQRRLSPMSQHRYTSEWIFFLSSDFRYRPVSHWPRLRYFPAPTSLQIQSASTPVFWNYLKTRRRKVKSIS